MTDEQQAGTADDGHDHLKLTRFAHEFQRNSGSREMVEHEDGEWVQYEKVKDALSYVDGYLDAHIAMLKGQGVHPTICEAIELVRKDIGGI